MSHPEIVIRDMAPPDTTSVAGLQARVLSESLVTQLGVSFVRRFLQLALEHPATVALVAMSPRGIVGFCVATSDVQGFKRYVRRRILGSLAVALASHPRLGRKFLNGLVEREPAPPMPAELLLVAVDDWYQGGGIGRQLLAAWEERLSSHAAECYRVAVRSQLLNAIAFYDAAGFQFEQQLPVFGEPMTYMVRRLRNAASQTP